MKTASRLGIRSRDTTNSPPTCMAPDKEGHMTVDENATYFSIIRDHGGEKLPVLWSLWVSFLEVLLTRGGFSYRIHLVYAIASASFKFCCDTGHQIIDPAGRPPRRNDTFQLLKRSTIHLATQARHGTPTLLRTRSQHERAWRRRRFLRLIYLCSLLERVRLSSLLSWVFSREALLVRDSQKIFLVRKNRKTSAVSTD